MPDDSSYYTATQSPVIKPKSRYSLKSILLAVIAAFITSGFIIGAVILIFPQIPTVVYVRKTFPESKYSYIYQVPKPREINKDTGIKGGDVISFGGMIFKSPWTSKPTKLEKEGSESYVYKTEGKVIFLFKDLPEIFNSLPPNGKKEDIDKLKLFYGSDALESKYSFYKVILETDPKTLSIFTTKKEAVAKSILVMYKVILQPPLQGGIYGFETDTVRGFQFGDPKVSKGVELDFFDSQDNPYNVMLRGPTQEEIDFLISSIEIIKR